MSRMRVDELIAQADAQRRARPGWPVRAPHGLRLGALRLMARGLRVEREVQFSVARTPEC
jgi:hypothetical protein